MLRFAGWGKRRHRQSNLRSRTCLRCEGIVTPEPIWFRNPPRSTIDPAAPPETEKAKVSISIDGRAIDVPIGSTIIDACKTLGIEIPTLCYLETLTPVNACRVCVVEVEGARVLAPACSRQVEAGMAIKTRSKR